MDELRKSNQELLQKLKIGQAKAWDILNNSSVCDVTKPRDSIVDGNIFKPPYAFSTPTKTIVDFLDKAGDEKYHNLAKKTSHSPKHFKDPSYAPLSEIMNLSSASSYGRPHKTPSKERHSNISSSPAHSPLCTENHRERLHRKLNASYSKLAADLRTIAPAYGADLAYDLSINSGLQNKPDSYYDDLKKFRMANSDLCSVKLPDQLNVTKNITHIEEKENVEVDETDHQCIQTYSVSDGYRAVDAHGGGQCPLCIGANDTKHKGLIRVNIPHKDLVNYKVHPRDVDDSVSLSSHCSMGWDVTSTQYKGRKQH